MRLSLAPCSLFLAHCSLLIALVGCGGQARPTAVPISLPTQMAISTLPAGLVAVVEAAELTTTTATIDPSLPATFTPAAAAVQVATLPPRVEQGTPTPTPIIPTRTPTRTPTPIPPTQTPTPVPWPTLPPTDELGPSKLSIHVIQNNDPAIMEFVRRAQPPVIKAVGDMGFLAEVKRVSPNTLTIGRVDDIFAQNYVGVPEEAAWDYVDKHLATYRANPWVDYWEGWNEPDPNMNNMPWYARYEQERVRLMASYGFKSAIGGFSTGVPELEEFWLFLPAIETALQYDGILTLHEYSAPTIYNGYGSALPNQSFYADRGSLMFRYRWFYREILEPQGLVIPLVITEAGIDGIIGNRPGPSGRGWRDFGGYWVGLGGGRTATEAYINQLAWYDVGVRQDGYVIGFTIFTAGDIPGWETYSIDDILPDLANYVIGQRR